MDNYITCDIQPGEWCTTECWSCPEAKEYEYFCTCEDEQEFKELESFLFGQEFEDSLFKQEFDENSGSNRFYVIYNNKNFCYNIINEFGKWRIITE